MSDYNETQPGLNEEIPNPTPVAFCQNCGKPLNQETVRIVGPAVYCEPCLAAKIGGSAPGPDATGYTHVNTGAPGAPGTPFNAWSAPVTHPPNPGLAALLGLIPGVGAMYNEQYAKGVAHLAIFAVLVLLMHASGIFFFFVIGWIIYMAMEAHHTAQAKRDGMPLPNPFGLNDIGERMGFDQRWANPESVANAARDAANAAATGFRAAQASGSAAPPPQPPPQPGAASAGWGAPVDAYAPPVTPPQQPWDWRGAAASATYAPPRYGQANVYGSAPPPYAPPYVPPVVQPIVPPVVSHSRFPIGAVWLIALGTIFLLGTEGIFSGIRLEAIFGFCVLALGATVFVRRMTVFGHALPDSMQDDGSSDYQFRLLYALRPSVWILLVAVLLLLDAFNLLLWRHSWPLFIIMVGVMMMLRHVPHRAEYPYAAPPVQPVPADPSSDLAPLTLRHDPPSNIDSEGGR